MVTRAVCRSCLTAGRRAVLKSPPHRRGCAQSRLPKLGDSGLAEYSCITALWANIRICRQWSATAGRPLCRPTVRKGRLRIGIWPPVNAASTSKPMRLSFGVMVDRCVVERHWLRRSFLRL